MKTISSSVEVSRINIELIYSVFILIFIPGVMILNSVLNIVSIKNHTEYELQNRAATISQVLNTAVFNRVNDLGSLQPTIEDLMNRENEIESIDVVKPEGQKFQIVVSDKASEAGTLIEDEKKLFHYRNAFSVQEPLALEYTSSASESGRVWSVISPVKDEGGNVIALADVELSSSFIDQSVNSVILRSIIITAVTVVVVALLLANHFRFARYAQLTKKLQEADRLKTDFLSVATHELKAPMTTIKGYVSNVIDGTFGNVNQEMKSSLNQALKQTDRLNNLVQDLLNVSRIEQGRISYDIKPVNVSDVIQPIVRDYRIPARAKGITIDYSVPEKPFFVLADTTRYQEIMTNLVDNAVKYSRQGKITIRHEANNKIIKTIVRDSGIGMSPEDRENLFSRFYRIRNEDTQNIGGTGLGLWIIKQYIEQMGGKIYVDSMRGVGSEFTVELPRAKADTKEKSK